MHSCYVERLPSPFVLGEGNVLLIQGWTTYPGHRGARYEVTVDGARFEFPFAGEIRFDLDAAKTEGHVAHEFWLPVPLGTEWWGRRALVHADLMTKRGRWPVLRQTVDFVRRLPVPPEPPPTTPLVVCMTTCEPDLALFRRQVRSLSDQTYRDWTCLLQDDASSPELYREIQAICRDDGRFVLERHARNIGFYRNFEYCLSRVPESAQYVALCDQDDIWSARKLEVSLRRLRDDVALAYCDMRRVDTEGRLLAASCWTERANNFESLRQMFLANTVSGAGSVMRNDVLRWALPFPDVPGEVYHDHWLACVAMAAGRLDYIDEPLYDYVQHARNVIGHRSSFSRAHRGRRMRTLRRILAVTSAPGEVLRTAAASIPTYRNRYRRLNLFRRLLLMRFPGLATDKMRELDPFADRLTDAWRLLRTPIARGARKEMDGHDLQLALSLAAHKSLLAVAPLLRLTHGVLNAHRQARSSPREDR